MRSRLHSLLILAACASLSVSAPLAVLAQDAPPLAPVVAAQQAGPATLTVDQVNALLRAQAGLPAPAAGPVTASGILGLPWETIFGGLGGLLALVFGLLKGATALRVRRVLQDAIAGAWWVAERNFKDLDGTAKATAAMGALYAALAGQKIPLDPAIGAQAQATWVAMSAAQGLAKPLAPVPPADLAAAKAAVQVAADPSSATALSDKAAR